MARMKERPCPGCQKLFSQDGTQLCGLCQADLERGRKNRQTQTAREVAGETLQIDLGQGFLYRRHFVERVDTNVRNEGFQAFLELAGAERPMLYSRPDKTLFTLDGLYHGNRAIRLPEWRYALLETVLNWLHDELSCQYVAGFQAGRSWLTQLANGELSVADMNEVESKIGNKLERIGRI